MVRIDGSGWQVFQAASRIEASQFLRMSLSLDSSYNLGQCARRIELPAICSTNQFQWESVMTLNLRFSGQSLPVGSSPSAQQPMTSAGLTLDRSFSLVAQRGIGGADHVLVAEDGKHVVALELEGAPMLVLSPSTVESLFAGTARRGGIDEVRLPSTLGGGTRGLKSTVIKAVHIFTSDNPVETGTKTLADAIESQVRPGVWKLDATQAPLLETLTRPLQPGDPQAARGPLLVFIHGTASSTSGSFGALWDRPAQHDEKSRAEQLFAHYDGRMYALDHRSLTESPIDNALALANALPFGARLHLVSHSRGGLVADLLCRAQRLRLQAGGFVLDASPPFDEADFQALQGEAYETHRDNLRSLGDTLKTRNISVERVVRVASPARGTTLASGRLDLYFSVLGGLLKVGGGAAMASGQVVLEAAASAADKVVGFAAAIALNRRDALKLPGIEAMMPERPLVRLLNRQDIAVASELRVIAGDIEGEGFFGWLKVRLTDAFYWEDHDLIVNTASMDQGARRLPGKGFRMFVKGPEVSHFNYFRDNRSANALIAALMQPVPPSGFDPIQAGADRTTRGARPTRSTDGAHADRPAVIVVHGIMGSHLKVDDKRVWFSLPEMLAGGIHRLDFNQSQATPDGLVALAYGSLVEHLWESHEVIEFAYDWRAPTKEASRRLAQALGGALRARSASGQPVRIMTHSTGGVVARCLPLVDEAVWNEFLHCKGSRVVMLGAPNRGSFMPAAVLTGRDPFVDMLDALDFAKNQFDYPSLAAGFPGFLELLGGEAIDPHWYDSMWWEELRKGDVAPPPVATDESTSPGMRHVWKTPAQGLLDAARAFRRELAAQDFGAHADKFTLVLGYSPETPVDARSTPMGVEFAWTNQGDGRVAWKSSELPGAKLKPYYVDASHGALASCEQAFAGYVDLLQTGATNRLSERPPHEQAPRVILRRGTEANNPLPPTEQEVLSAALGAWPPRRMSVLVPKQELRIEVLHASLAYVDEPLMVGHQNGSGLYSAERMVDVVFKGRLSEASDLGLYPGPLGTSEVFLPPLDAVGRAPKVRPQKAIIVGLGEVGRLSNRDLRDTVRQAVMRFVQVSTEGMVENAEPKSLELATLLLGTGASDVSVTDSMEAMITAVTKVNETLSASRLKGRVRIGSLKIVEIYESRAADALRAAKQLAADPRHCGISVTETLQRRGRPYRLAHPANDANGWPQFIGIVESEHDARQLVFSVLTDRARSEVHVQATQRQLIDALVKQGESSNKANKAIGQTLFELLFPNELKSLINAERPMVFEVDRAAAAYPWEMMQDRDAEPIALQTRMVRKLRSTRFRRQPVAALTSRALVIGAPKSNLPRLEGARAEAAAVARRLRERLKADPNGKDLVKALDEPMMSEVMEALFGDDYQILHFAGHGRYVPPSDSREDARSGIVLSDSVMLTPVEIGQMRTVPELVFVNCCSLGKVDIEYLRSSELAQRILTQDRGAFAANLGAQLIENGVRCVIAAAWEVDDDAARLFAEVFYDRFFSGSTFGDAVLQARRSTSMSFPQSNTWGAYQCYGDIEWRLIRQSDVVAVPPPTDPLLPTGLVEALEAVEVQSDGADRKTLDRLLTQVADFEGRLGLRWRHLGEVADAFGNAYEVLGRKQDAIRWYRLALDADDGQARMRSWERMLNLQVRTAGSSAEIIALLPELQKLDDVGKTSERAAILGSAFKRMAVQFAKDRRQADFRRAVLHMSAWYCEALSPSRGGAHDGGSFYPLMNAVAADSALALVNGGKFSDPAATRARIERARKAICAALEKEPDFWAHAAEEELAIHESLLTGALATDAPSIALRLKALRASVGTEGQWSSIHDAVSFLSQADELSRVGRRDRRKTAGTAPAADVWAQLLTAMA